MTSARCVAITVMLSMVSAQVHAFEPDPAAQEAADLYRRGISKYETSDYKGAVDLFTRAFTAAHEMEDDQARVEATTALLFNLARAHVKAQDLDGDTAHLHQARELLGKYLQREIPQKDREDAEALLRSVEEELAGLDAKDSASAEGSPARDSTPADKPKLSGLMIAGIVTTGLGVGMSGLMIAGLVQSKKLQEQFEDNPDDRYDEDLRNSGARANTMAIAGGAVAGVLVVTGITLIVVDRVRKRKNVALVPTGSRTWAGLSLVGHM